MSQNKFLTLTNALMQYAPLPLCDCGRLWVTLRSEHEGSKPVTLEVSVEQMRWIETVLHAPADEVTEALRIYLQINPNRKEKAK